MKLCKGWKCQISKDLGVNPRRLLMFMLFNDLCEELDRCSRKEQVELVVRLCDRYLVDIQGILGIVNKYY